jgi:hypothetical protein
LSASEKAQLVALSPSPSPFVNAALKNLYVLGHRGIQIQRAQLGLEQR